MPCACTLQPAAFFENADHQDHLVDRLDAGNGVEEHARRRVLEEQLATAPARHERVALAVDTRERDELAAAGHVEARDERALRAQPESVRGVLDVRARDHATVVNDRCDAHGEVRVRGVRVGESFLRDAAQGIPVGLGLRSVFAHDFMYGFPEAAGPRT